MIRRRPEFFEEARAECGDLFVLDIGLDELVVIGDAFHAEEVLVKQAKYFDKGGNMWAQLRKYTGQGLAFSEGELWRKQRRLMNPQFRRKRIQGFREVMAVTIDELVVELDEQAAHGQTFDVSTWTAKLLGTLTTRLLFGCELEAETFERLRDAFGTVLGSFMLGAVTGALPSWMPVPGVGRLKAAMGVVHEIILELIAERRRSGAVGADLLSMLAHAAGEDGAMSDRQLLDEIVVLYTAGYETTAQALAWTMTALADQPEVVATLQARLDACEDDLAEPFLDATFREGLRLFPSAPLLPRRVVEDVTLGGYEVPAGRQVLVLPWLIHRNPAHWSEPERFDPARFLDGRQRPRLSWMPFGAGQRQCIGMGLAMMEGKLALAAMLRRFTPRPADRPSEPVFAGTLGSADGVWVRLASRTNTNSSQSV
ncbi:cytochrome P450 family protein [Plesiocystis pacifica SIR-1]|uniref:Cytochrome P450 family protein n=2 Tax=Plesiocystis pacifica TaxID=191768 RepID=A6FX68_9BACT|nr:cytochrome P450 family protein [Plesiocystis pacifica SIR-1]